METFKSPEIPKPLTGFPLTLSADTIYGLGLTLIFLGILITVVAVLMLFIAGLKGEAKSRGGGAIIIGPFPIIFGTDKESIKDVLILSIVLIAILVALTVLLHFLYAR
jgi:uncharacterized membrane protein